MGTSVNLKNTYAGYGIEFIVHHDSVQNMISFITDQIPGELCIRDMTCALFCYVLEWLVFCSRLHVHVFI